MILFFTGTGNSRYCAQMLADKLDDEVLDAFPFLRDGAAPDLFSDRPWVFVAPTYGWQLPRVFAQLIRSGRFRGSRDAYFVMTCGGDIGNAAAKNRKLCTEAGLCDRGTLEVVMPENYIAMYDVPGEAEARDLVAAARPVIERGRGRQTEIRHGQQPVLSLLRQGPRLCRVRRLHWLRQM